MSLVLLAPLIAAAVVALVALTLQLQRRGQQRLVGWRVDDLTPPAAELEADPVILYFTGEHCSVCHVAQQPALHSLQERLGRTVRIREIDVAADPALARRYRVLTLPTTIVLRPDNTVAAINAGFAPANTLQQQLLSAGMRIPTPAGV